MARSAGFSINIRATDEVSERVHAINRALQGLGKTAKASQTAVDPTKLTKSYDEFKLNSRALGRVIGEQFDHGRRRVEEFGKSVREVTARLGMFSPALGALVFSEPVSMRLVIGIVLILCGLFFTAG